MNTATRRSFRFVAAASLVALAACSPDQTVRSSPDTSRVVAAAATTTDADVALVVTEDGLAAVPVGTSEPIWVDEHAVAAPDGSAVYSLSETPGDPAGFEVSSVDPATGDRTSVGRHSPGPAGIRIAAVEPGGEQVVLIAPDGDATTVLTFVAADGGFAAKQRFEGRLEPEALSVDRTRVFAARIYADRYHVHVLDLTTAEQYPTFGPDKSLPPEDMYGDVVQAVLAPDSTQLATLYRDDRGDGHTAFVHLLSLNTGQTVCIDLYEPFGTGGVAADAIEWRADGTVAVGHTGDRRVVATFDPAAIWGGDPQPHYHAETVDDPAPPALPDGVADVPGFRRFVAISRS